MRQMIFYVALGMFLFAGLTSAAEPNYVRTTVYDVNSNENDIVLTEYSDGLGRTLQSKQIFDGDFDRNLATFYDDAGRPYLSTKMFIDDWHITFNPGNLKEIIEELDGSLIASSIDLKNYKDYIQPGQSSAFAYSETEYYDDPLGRVKSAGAPGYDYRLGSGHETKFWYFGVPNSIDTETVAFNVTINSNTIHNVSKIINGFISEFQSSESPIDTVIFLDSLYAHLLANRITDSDHFLTVTMDPNGKITQELKDLFGRTVATRSMNGTETIIAQYEFDILGNVLKEIAPGNNLIGNSEYQYNTLGQLILKISPDGAIERMEYDDAGNLLRKKTLVPDGSTEMLKQSLLYSYDDLGRLEKILEESIVDPATTPLVHTQNFYDNTETLTNSAKKFKIPLQVLSKLENLQGRLVAAVASNVINGKTYFVTDLHSYDDDGRVKNKYKVILGLPLQQITYEYDIHGKLLKEIFKSGTEQSAKLYAYDKFGQLKKAAHTDDIGDYSAIDNDEKKIADYTYDNFGRLTSKEFSKIDLLDKTASYKYTIREWLQSVSYNGPNRFSERIGYTDNSFNGNITNDTAIFTNVTSAGGSYATRHYNHRYEYDDVNRLVNVQTLDIGNAPITEFDADYTYNNIGRFLTKKEGDSNHDEYLYYGNTNRLKKSKSNGGLYLYDEHGNMVIDVGKKMVITYDWRNMPIKFSFYDALPVGDNVSNAKIRPDARGTMTIYDNDGYTGTTERYVDWLQRQGQISLLSTVFMLYDASGKRVLKSTSNTTTSSVQTYTLATTVAGSGSILLSPPGGTYNAGTEVTLTATPGTGYSFSEWSGNLTGTTPSATITIDTDKNVTATFTEIPEADTIQAENSAYCIWISGTEIDSDNLGFTGTGFVNTPNTVGAWTQGEINVTTTGTYQIKVRYANGSGDARGATVAINGLTLTNHAVFATTNNWTTWAFESITNVFLNAGTNTIKLTAQTSGGLANIDFYETSK